MIGMTSCIVISKRKCTPYTNIISQNTPQAFAEALAATRERLDNQENVEILNINCWNEWTEGSYLEPDTHNGNAYLEAIKRVFGCSE